VTRQTERSSHAWSYFWSVLGSLTASFLLTIFPKVVGVAGTFGRVVESVPLWVSFPFTFLAALGLISILQMLFKSSPSRLQTQEYHIPEPLETADIVIDLRSLAPLVVLFTTQLPEIAVTLRVANFSDYDITVTHLKVSVWFGQPTTELTLDAPFEVGARTEKDDVFMRKLLEDSASSYIKAYLARSEDWTNFIALDVTMSGTSTAGSFQRSRHFELRSHDIKGVVR
jgi:hypothetical protein